MRKIIKMGLTNNDTNKALWIFKDNVVHLQREHKNITVWWRKRYCSVSPNRCWSVIKHLKTELDLKVVRSVHALWSCWRQIKIELMLTNIYSSIILTQKRKKKRSQMTESPAHSCQKLCRGSKGLREITIKSCFSTCFVGSSSYTRLISLQLSKHGHGNGLWGHQLSIWHERSRPVDVSSGKLPWHELSGKLPSAIINTPII